MTKFPLLIGAKVTVKESCRVPLGKGRWRVTANHVNSRLTVVDGNSHLLPQGGEVIIDGPAVIYIVINEPGSENSLSAFAELIDDISSA